jgi:hypothetical protein
MHMKNRMNLRSLLKISGMSLGIGVVHQFAPMLAHQVEAEIANVFARNRAGGGNIRREQRYLPLKAE